VVWVVVVFTSTLGISRSLAQEHDKGILDALLLAPIDRAALFYGKCLTTWLYAFVVATFVTVALAFLFNLGIPAAWWLIIFLGTVGLAAVGTLLGSMAIHARGRETTLPIIVLPVALPILMASVSASALILAGRPFADWATWPVLLLVTDVIFLALPLLLFEYVIEE
jgi:heme exporter protein B